MSRLTAPPAAPVRTLDELAAVARALREETARRYAEAARRMRQHGGAAAAEALDALAAEGRRSGAGDGGALRAEPGGAPRALDLRRMLPDLIRDEADEMAPSRLATPYRVFAAGVRDAERAFAAWTYLAAYAATTQIRRAAEILAGEELDRIARLRGERRRAYWAERAPASGQEPPVASVETLERRMADRLDRLSAELPPAEAVRAREFAAEARSMADEASCLDDANPPFAGSGEPAHQADPLLATAERLVERYIAAADGARGEGAMARAQSLARRAIVRLAWLGAAPMPGRAPLSRPPC